MNCKNCFTRQCLISFIVLFVFLMLYDYLVHGQLLMGMYETTASLWRPQSEMQDMMVLCWLYHAAIAAAICCLYKKMARAADEATCAVPGEKHPISPRKIGLCFGLGIGILIGVMQAGYYMWLPIPGALAVAWFVSGLIKGMLAGLLLSFTYNPKGSART